MKKEKESSVLSSDLYNIIMNDKTKLIAILKEKREKLTKKIVEELITINGLKAEKKEIKNKIRLEKRALKKSRKEKYKLNREISAQVKLSNNLTNIFVSEEETAIYTDDFYPENKQNKIEIKSRM